LEHENDLKINSCVNVGFENCLSAIKPNNSDENGECVFCKKGYYLNSAKICE